MKYLITFLLAFLMATLAMQASARGKPPMFPTQHQGQGQGQDQQQGQLQGQAMQQGIYVNTAAGAEAASVTAAGLSADTLINAATQLEVAETNRKGLRDMGRKRVPDAYAPPLTTSNDTCMGSSSIGGSGAGFGVSVGSAWTDHGCTARADARVLFNMGLKDEAILRLCERPKMAAVLSQCADSGNTSLE